MPSPWLTLDHKLCFSRQIWSSINRADYKALRLGFITTHNLPLSYDFHNYMLRSMEEEFRDIVGISIPLWIFAISCIFLGFHGTNIYFWLSFLPAIFVLLVGTKLHRIVIKLAVETKNTSQSSQINLRDELFWFGRPRLLLRLIQFISFQNAFEMATCLWSLMGSRFKKTIVSENVRESLHTWRRRVKAKHKHDSPFTHLPTTSSNMSLDSMVDDDHDEHIARVQAFLDKSKSNADIEVSTHDENVSLDPVRHENEDCYEIYSSSELQRFEPVTESL